MQRVVSFQEDERTKKKHTQRQEIEQLKHTFFGFRIEKNKNKTRIKNQNKCIPMFDTRYPSWVYIAHCAFQANLIELEISGSDETENSHSVKRFGQL